MVRWLSAGTWNVRRAIRRRTVMIALGLTVAPTASGCGSQGADRARVDYSRNPYALTCDVVLAIDSVKARQFHKAAFALAGEVRLPGTHRNIVWGRFVY